MTFLDAFFLGTLRVNNFLSKHMILVLKTNFSARHFFLATRTYCFIFKLQVDHCAYSILGITILKFILSSLVSNSNALGFVT